MYVCILIYIDIDIEIHIICLKKKNEKSAKRHRCTSINCTVYRGGDGWIDVSS